MPAFTTLLFQVDPFDGGQRSALSVTPILNGVPLTRLIEEFERSQQVDKAGGYAGTVPRNYHFGPLNCHFLPVLFGDELLGDWQINERYLLGCSCGEVGCWPLTADITKRGDNVTRDNFL
jgi:hypothetical protein